jgi:hypothetical protein
MERGGADNEKEPKGSGGGGEGDEKFEHGDSVARPPCSVWAKPGRSGHMETRRALCCGHREKRMKATATRRTDEKTGNGREAPDRNLEDEGAGALASHRLFRFQRLLLQQ